MAVGTAEAMARGGLYDQLGGGFARYSVDADWIVPHFEKMLYDNALLAVGPTRTCGARTGSALAGRVAAETCAWMIRELGTAQGGFAAALDADSEGEEGKFYVWTLGQLRAVLGPAAGQYAAQAFGVTDAGTFERGSSVLQLRADPADPERMARIKDLLLTARAKRVEASTGTTRLSRPGTGWPSPPWPRPACCSASTGPPRSRPERGRAAGRDAPHRRTAGPDLQGRHGGPERPSVLEDYACVADGFIALKPRRDRGSPLARPGLWELLATSLDRFGDPSGGFYDTADDGEALIYRPADAADGPSPSSGTLQRWLAALLSAYAAPHRVGAPPGGCGRLRSAALPAIAARYPRAAGSGLAVAEALLSGPVEIAIVGPPGDERTAELHRTALLAAPPGAVIAVMARRAMSPAAPAGRPTVVTATVGARPHGGTGGQAESGDGDGGRTAAWYRRAGLQW